MYCLRQRYRINNYIKGDKMRQSHKFLSTLDNSFYRRYLQPLLAVAGVLLLSLVSSSVFALESNPGSNAICSAGATKGFLSDDSYSRLIDSFTSNSYQNVVSNTEPTGNTNANIPLKIKMSINDVGINNTGNNTTVTGTTANPAIDINRNFNSQTSRSDISLEFQDSDNGKVVYLNKVAVSVFDIDKRVSWGRGWDDLVKITGVTENDGVIEGKLQAIPNSSVIKLPNGLQTSSYSNIYNCTDELSSACQGSVLFDKPVKSVTLKYSNTSNVTNPTTQRIQFRLDSYCYTPKYTFLGTVFNDNGGLSGSPKNDLTNSFINTYKYFNGVFDNGESGIDGSALNNLKVRLTDCNSTDITGTTHQNVSDTGSYSFTVPASAVAGKSQVCLIQEEPDPWSYSVDTTPNRLEVPINNSVYLYEDNNFGEVIAEQTALVLKKYQYVHQCDANLNYNNILDKDSPLNGFSINAPRQDEKVDPGQCIAYKIEAYNHGHITLTDIRITDILQKTPVESVFHLPNSSGIAASLRTTDNPTSGLVNIGDNGVIITEPFKLTNTAKTTTVSKRTLYFNTKYGN